MTPSASIAPERAHGSTGRCDSHPGHNASLPGKPVLPRGGYVTISPRVKLVTLSTVRAIRGTDAETVTNMVDNMIHPQHIRFAFNVSHKSGKGVRDLRFWMVELAAPVLVRKFSVQDVIGEILGSRESFQRGELEIQWTCSATLIGKLIKERLLTLRGRLITRKSLETFLFSRFSGNCAT